MCNSARECFKCFTALKIKNILVSQPAPAVPDKSPFNEIVTKHGVNISFLPFIKVEGVSLKEFRSQRIEIPGHSAVIFTSRTTIDSFFRICEEARTAVSDEMKYFCSTEAIALYLQKYIVYRKRKIFFADGSFQHLMELLQKHKNEKFLLTLTEPHKPEMAVAMEKMKLQFDKAILARTVSADLEEVDINRYDMLVFYSPSEIHSLVSRFTEINGSPRIATFGHGTAQTAIEAGLTVSVMAPTAEVPSMTKAIDIYINRVTAGETVEPVTLAEPSPQDAFIKAQEAKPVKRARPVPSGSVSTPVKAKTQSSKNPSK